MNLRTVNYGPFDPLQRFTRTTKSLSQGHGFGVVINIKLAPMGNTSTSRHGVYYDWYRSALVLNITLPWRRFTWFYLFTDSKRSRTMPWPQRLAELEARKATA